MEEIEDTAKQAKLKGVVEHTLSLPSRERVSCRLLCDCILSKVPGPDKSSDLYKTYTLQRRLRRQYFRLIQHDPDNRLRYTYSFNCCPVGFDVEPKTRFCTQPQVCPWCHVRRWLLPAYKALHAVPKSIRESHALVVWRRGVLHVKAPPFFASNYGPHQWCDSLVTVQLGFPWPYLEANAAPNSVVHYHIGMQIVPKSCDVHAALNRRAVSPALSIARTSKATTENIFKLMAHVTSLPWLSLYDEQNFQFFAKTVKAKKFKSSRLLRITPYRERNTDGNHHPSVPEE